MKATKLQAFAVGVLALTLTGCASVGSRTFFQIPGAVAAPPAQAQPVVAAAPGSVEEAIQSVILRGNQQQEQAIASRDSSLMRDTSTDSYYQDAAQTNQDLLDNGVTAIQLVNIDWGPVTVDGSTATATTYETWSTQMADGTSEQSRDRNIYTLVQQDGGWKIQSDEHPDDVVTTGPAGPRTTSPSGEASPGGIDPGPQIIPRGRGQSANWAGYVARGGGFASVTGTWTVPQPAASTTGAADAAWIGIGGESTRDLIQAGTEEAMLGSGRVQYSAWIETLPQVSRTVPLAVHAGDSVTVSIAEQQPGSWQIDFQNNTTGGTYSRTVQYTSSHSSAEWIEEAPSGRGGMLPLDDFGSVTFTDASAIKSGGALNLTQANAQSITMTNDGNQPVVTTSSISGDGAGFTVTRTENSAASGGSRGGGRGVSPLPRSRITI
jgi:hypothetical protein